MVTRSLTIGGMPSKDATVHAEAILTHTDQYNIERITIRMERLNLSGKLFLGNVLLELDNVVVRNASLLQEYHRRMDVTDLEISASGTTIAQSIIGNRPLQHTTVYDAMFRNCHYASFTCIMCNITDSLVNITAKYIEFTLGGSLVTATQQMNDNEIGVYLNPGKLLVSEETTSSLRRRRSATSGKDDYGYLDNFKIDFQLSPVEMYISDEKEVENENTKDRTLTEYLKHNSDALMPILKETFAMETFSTWNSNPAESRRQHKALMARLKLKERIEDSLLQVATMVRHKNISEHRQHYHQTGELQSGLRQRRSVTQDTTAISIKITDSNFTNIWNPLGVNQAALRVVGNAFFTLGMKDCRFSNNSRGLDVSLLANNRSYVFVEDSVFIGNKANGPGGGLHFSQQNGNLDITIERCKLHNNEAMGMPTIRDTDVQSEEENVEISQITGSGGAIAAVFRSQSGGCKLNIKHCTFVNNTAENYGGAVYITFGVEAFFGNNVFKNALNPNSTRSQIGEVIESHGNMLLFNNTFHIQSAVDEVSLISYRADKDGSFMESYNSVFTCPHGYSARSVVNYVTVSSSRSSIETLLLYCRSCHQGQYSLHQSEIIVDQTSGVNVQHVENSTCLPCPYGGLCITDVASKANFWGHNDDGVVRMYLCPQGYCCPNATCKPFNTCAENRRGALCGRCNDGYSESLFSTKCILNSECTYASAFWAVIAGYGLLYVLLFVLEGEIQNVISNFTAEVKRQWSKRQRCRFSIKCLRSKKREVPKNRSSEENADEGRAAKDGAFLQIFMYYVQVPSLITIDILYQDGRSKPFKDISSKIANIFSFNTFGINLSTCLFPGVTAVFKIWAKTAFVLYLFITWLLLLLVSLPVSALFGDRLQSSRWTASITMRGRYLGVLVNLLLYTYQYFAENSFRLLRCIDMPPSRQSVLYLDGSVTCFQDWQWGILAFSLVFVIPFWLVLLYGPWLLYRRHITLKLFFVGLLLPLFVAPYFIYIFHRRRGPSEEQYRAAQSQEQQGERDGSIATVQGIVFEPYRHNLGGGLCWEGVIALRRLVLVLLATLEPNVLLRHIGLTLTCFLALMVHIRLKPFAAPINNTIENASLAILVLVSMVNMLKAAYFESGNIPSGVPDQVLVIYDWIEAILLGLLPVIMVAFVGLALVATIVILLTTKCRKMHKKRKQTNLRRVAYDNESFQSTPNVRFDSQRPLGRAHQGQPYRASDHHQPRRTHRRHPPPVQRVSPIAHPSPKYNRYAPHTRKPNRYSPHNHKDRYADYFQPPVQHNFNNRHFHDFYNHADTHWVYLHHY